VGQCPAWWPTCRI